jgi:hypothetical protein
MAGNRRLISLWNDSHASYSRWTNEILKILIESAKMCFKNQGVQVVAKGHRDEEFERSEYFNIDLIAYESGWEKPVLALEHENSQYLEWIKYCAWKLASLDCQYRILFCYFNPNTTRPKDYAQSMGDIKLGVKEVLKYQKGKHIFIIAGNYDEVAKASKNGWENVFQTAYV